jgi:hypothetical protein
LDREVRALMERGQKIEAIRLYRERTGVSLKEAKDYVEALGLRHGIKPANVGCGTTALLLGVAVGLIYWASRLL